MWSYIVNLFHRSLGNHPLTPRERAFLKSLQGVLIGFVVDAAPQIYQVIGGHAKFNLSNAMISALIGALVAYILKLWQAQGDSSLAALLDAYAKAKEREALGSLTVPAADGSVSVPALQLMLPLVQALVMESNIHVGATTAPIPSLHNEQTAAMPAINAVFPMPGGSGIHIADMPTANVPAVNFPPAQP